MELQLWLAFVAASTALLLIPGPTVLLVLSYALSKGRSVAIASAAGVASGDFIAMSLSLAGLGALVAASATLFTVLKWVGAAYLIWMGIRSFRDNPAPAETGPAGTSRSTAGRSFANGFVQVLLNPPTYAFYASLPVIFVLVVDALPVAGVGTQIAVFGVATNLVFLAVDLVFVATLDRFSGRVSQKPAVRRAIQWLTGTALVALGVRLATRSD